MANNNEETIVMNPGSTGQNNNTNTNIPPRPNVQAGPQRPYQPAYQPASSGDDQTWKRVIIGGVAGIMFGTVSAVGATAAYHHFANNEDPTDPQPTPEPAPVPDEGHYTMENGLQVAEVSDDMSFSEAFAAARAEVGAGGVFVWHGGVYGTYYETEWNNMSAAERNEFAQLSQPAIEQQAPIHHPDDHVDVVYHDPEVRVHNVNNDISMNDDDVQIVGVEEVTLADGSTATMAQATVDGHEVYMVDVDQDGVFDVAAFDSNGNGSLDDGEMMDISGQGIASGATPTQAANFTDTDDMGMVSGDMLVDSTLPGVDDDLPNYMDDGGDMMV